jgi:putative glycosyltransferase (TIGR04348 family)
MNAESGVRAFPARRPHSRSRRAAIRIVLVTPAPPGSRQGNRTTALRWARLLRGLGHRTAVGQEWTGQRCDLLVALHARKSHASIARFAAAHPGRPIALALTGTDLYGDLGTSVEARRSIELATRLIVLQPLALQELPPEHRPRARLIRQSVPAPRRPARKGSRHFDVGVLAHLRPVKDPFRAALASRLLPPSSRVRILQIGAALDPDLAERARAEERGNPRYRWLGELPRGRALRVLSRCRAMVLSSRMEGGANAASEAIVLGVPVLASRVPGNVGMLGEDWPAYFEFGEERQLASLLQRIDEEPRFLADLERRIRGLAPLYVPELEQAAWRELLIELAGA